MLSNLAGLKDFLPLKVKGDLLYGLDYLDRPNEEVDIPFWRDIIVALQKLRKSDIITNKD